MPRAGLERVFRALRPQRAINGYGPTETVVTPLVWKGDGSALPDSPTVPIGRPVGDRRCHILDGDLSPVPLGVTGELWIGGSGLARGYAGQPAATADRFIPDPFGPDPFGAKGGRLYRTGDLARWRADGTVEFLGRRDHQVKLRGFRVELGEIESHLTGLPGVREAAVLALEDGGVTRLVGYVAPSAGQTLDVAALTAALGRTLPPHMVPARLVPLAALPVTGAGKLDRAALPAPVWDRAAGIAPRTATEDTLVRLWREALSLAQVGVTDNFFEIGGDSILALQIVARARAAGLRVSPKDLLERQTIEALALVAEAVTGNAGAADAAPSGPSPLTPIQAWFFATAIPGRDRWNQSVLLATDTPVERDALQQALDRVAARHDALRLRFHRDGDGVWTQSLADTPATIPLDEAAAADDAAVTRLCDAVQGALDIAHGPLLRARLIRKADGGTRLFLAAHHLVVDGVSWRILLEDLRSAGLGPCARDPVPPHATPFTVWARRLAPLAADPRFLGDLDRWRTALAGPPLPVDHPGGANSRCHAATHSLRLDRALTRALLTDAAAAYRTRIDTLLLTALAHTVTRRWGLGALTVHLEGHGREDLFPDLDIGRTVGWFTSVHPLRLAPPDGWDAAIRHVKEAQRAVPHGGLGFNLLRHLGAPEVQAALAGGPVSLSFNYLGQFDNVAADGPWRAAPEDCGAGSGPDAPLGALLSIDGQILDGELTLHARFSTALFRAETIAALMTAYRAALTAVAAHCRTVEPGQATPSDFPLAPGLTQARLDALPVPAPAIADLLPLTPMQAAMIRHGLERPESDAYTVQVWATIDGLDVERLTAVWRTVTARHEILRGCVAWRGLPHPLLVVAKTAEMPVETLDWRDEPDVEAAWDRLRDEDYRRRFDPERAPLMRVTLARTGPATHRFLWTWHHALLDGWSMSRLLGEVLRLYDGETPPPPAARVRDVAAWTLARAAETRAAASWQDRLATLPAPGLLSGVLPRPDTPEPDGAVERTLDEAAVRRLQDGAAAEKVTLNTLVQAGWLRVLARVTGRTRVAFGATVSGRSIDLPGIESVIGLLVGTLPVVQDVEPDGEPDSGTALDRGDGLRRLLAANIALRQHEHAPPPALQCWSGRADAPFDTVLVFENYPVDEALRHSERGGLSFRDVGNRGRTSYPLTLVVVPRDTLTLRLEYSGAVFTAAAVTALADALVDAILTLCPPPP